MVTPARQYLIEINTSDICTTLEQCLGRRISNDQINKILLNTEMTRPIKWSYIKSDLGEELGFVESIEDVNGTPFAKTSLYPGTDAYKIHLHPRIRYESNKLVLINIDASYF